MNVPVVAAFDVGGSSIKAALLDAAGSRIAALRRAVPAAAQGVVSAVAVADEIADMAREMSTASGLRPVAAGAVVPGIVDEEAGIARFAANLGWRDVPFAAMLRDRLGVPVAFGHDVSAGGLAEWRLGAARGYRDVAVVPVGTGIAAALLLDGRPYRAGGHAGELGHVDIGHGLPCGCGAVGCLEVVASAGGIARRYGERAGVAATGAAEVLRAAEAGDTIAAEIVRDATEGLGKGLRVLATLVAPEVVVLGGGLFEAGSVLLDPVGRWLSANLPFQRVPRLVLAELGAEAGCLGAGLMALEVAGR
ncbi:glucokinase [Amycolatopsis marina]|uniref:Glucokinase n=1 Tax=Amycolatopsis marina TaxID=490629 RepID=A0A1I0WWN6_9PSEU|nr:ROK family protein [Amycolatopsis marina]SFA92827.1 glucokinase [Amycolatopsis marina]